LAAILSSATTAETRGPLPPGQQYADEQLNDRTFNFRMQGLNVDFMSYAALSLANSDVEALLDPSTLSTISARVFSTFFQHFVTNSITAESGSFGFQPINASLPWDLGSILNTSTYYETGSSYQDQNSSQITNRTVSVVLHTRIEQLDMSLTAVCLCLSILAFLVVTTIWVYARHRQYFKALPRDVDSLASVLGFVYGSPKLLQWVAENKDDPNWGERRRTAGQGEVMARMGSFDGSRWGIELVDADLRLEPTPPSISGVKKHGSGSPRSEGEDEALTTGFEPSAL
jgi:hypothetical protein